MNPERVYARGLKFTQYRAAQLHGFALRFNKRSRKKPGFGSANIVAEPGSYVAGILYELVSPAELARMDPYEHAPMDYRRFIVEVQVDNCPVAAWTYIAQAHVTDDKLKPASSYLEHLLARKDLLPNDYVDMLEAVECAAG